MQKELNQFECNQVWHLNPTPHDRPTIGTKWIFKYKLYESGNVIRNKTKLVVQGYTQIERIDFEKIFAFVVRLEAIQMTLSFSSFKDFKLFKWMLKVHF